MWRTLYPAHLAWPLALSACMARSAQPELVLEVISRTRSSIDASGRTLERLHVFTAALSVPLDVVAHDAVTLPLAADAELLLATDTTGSDACIANADPLCAWAQQAEAAVQLLIVSLTERPE
jgi:hypothetical protein